MYYLDQPLKNNKKGRVLLLVNGIKYQYRIRKLYPKTDRKRDIAD